MTAKPHVRRPLVILGVLVTLLAAAATVRAASMWAEASASLKTSPATVSSIEDALAHEQARSQTLQAQLDAMSTSSHDLEAALAAANGRVAADQAAAAALEASLQAAQAKLAGLEAALKAGQAGTAAPPSGGATTTPTYHDDGPGDD